MARRFATIGAFALLFLVCSAARAQTTKLQEFPFAAGAGGSFMNDTGHAADVKSFSTGGFHAFLELNLDPGILLQGRYERFQLPGSASSAPFQPAVAGPRIDVDAGNVTVAYVFRETWWEAGLFAGVGVYGLAPQAPEAGQTPVDVRETVIGWNGGTLLVFQVARRWDLRLEAAGYLLQTNVQKKLVRLGGSVAYHF